jgi:hypothetical protein
MIKAFTIVLLFGLAGCSGIVHRRHDDSPCSVDEASYACQVERYQNVDAN